MRNRFEATVEECPRRGSHAWLRVGRGRLAGRRWEGIRAGEKVAVGIRPEDVILARNHPGRISARNVLPGFARSIQRAPEGVYVSVDVGFPLVSLVTEDALRDLGIRRGAPLFAIVKATAILPEAGPPGAIRAEVSLTGPRGSIGPRRLALLRAIERMGSLSRAGKEVGITYRTAWAWAQEINRAWASPLVTKVTGGRGGGGSTLTPAGRAVLAYVSRLEDPCRPP